METLTKEAALAEQLKDLGYEVSISSVAGLVIIKAFLIQAGRHAGNVVNVAVGGGDFPFTPPAGVHVQAPLGQIGQNNVSQSPLGSGWQYWSRTLPNWKSDRGARHIIAYINKVFLDA